MDQGNLDIDNEEEIGLTEAEIKEITGESNLGVSGSDDPPELSGDLSDNLDIGEKFDQNEDPQKNSLEEIDFSDLEGEIDLIDFDDDSAKPSSENDMDVLDDNASDIEDLGLDVSNQLSEIDLSKVGEDSSTSQHISPSPVASKMSNTSSPSKPISSKGASQKVSFGNSRTGNKKPAVKKKSSQNQNSKVMKKTNNVKKPSVQAKTVSTVAKKTASRLSVSKVDKPLGSIELKTMGNTQQMKDLFLRLDEMLTKLPPEQIKQFALSKEYDYYLEILKKLGI